MNIYKNGIKMQKFFEGSLRRKILKITFATIFLLATINVIWLTFETPNLKCYDIQVDSLQDFSEVGVVEDNSIFFVDTSCINYKKQKIIISPQTACAVESAARHNTEKDIYLLFTSPGNVKIRDESDLTVAIMLSYTNIRMYRIHFQKFIADTPIDPNIYKKLQSSQYPLHHASDVLRILLLWKYGGTYLDTDFIVLKNFSGLGTNFVGLESSRGLNGAAMSFSYYGDGHNFTEEVIRMISKKFSGKTFVANGPKVLSDIIMEKCNIKRSEGFIEKSICGGIKILPREIFFPIHYGKWKHLYESRMSRKIVSRIENSYAVHLWSFMSAKMKQNTIGINSSISILAKKHCPKTSSLFNINNYF